MMWVGRLLCAVVQLVGSSSLLGVWSVLLLILGFLVVRWPLVVVGSRGFVLFENCIVDASIFFITANFFVVHPGSFRESVCVVCEGHTVDALA